MVGNTIKIYLDPKLSEDDVYEVTRQIKILDGVASVTLNHEEPHIGLVVLRPGADRDYIEESAVGIDGVTGIDSESLAA